MYDSNGKAEDKMQPPKCIFDSHSMSNSDIERIIFQYPVMSFRLVLCHAVLLYFTCWTVAENGNLYRTILVWDYLSACNVKYDWTIKLKNLLNMLK